MKKRRGAFCSPPLDNGPVRNDLRSFQKDCGGLLAARWEIFPTCWVYGRAQLAPTGKRRASAARVVGVKFAFAPASHSAPSAPLSCPFSPNRTRFAGLWLGFLFFCGDRSITDCRGDLWSPAGERSSPLQDTAGLPPVFHHFPHPGRVIQNPLADAQAFGGAFQQFIVG